METQVVINITYEKQKETRRLLVNGKTYYTEVIESRYPNKAGALAPVLNRLMLLTGDKKDHGITPPCSATCCQMMQSIAQQEIALALSDAVNAVGIAVSIAEGASGKSAPEQD